MSCATVLNLVQLVRPLKDISMNISKKFYRDLQEPSTVPRAIDTGMLTYMGRTELNMFYPETLREPSSVVENSDLKLIPNGQCAIHS